MYANALGIVAGLALAATANAQTIGLQFAGGSSCPANDIAACAELLARNPGARVVEVAFLPFEFTPRNPFGNMTRLAETFTATSTKNLRITIQLKVFVHDPVGGADALEFWDAWAAAAPTPRQLLVRNLYLQRVDDACAWVAALRASSLAGRLEFVCVPVVEDVCHAPEGYANLVAAIRDRQKASGAGNFAIRRSCLPPYAFRGTFDSLELHGPWNQVAKLLKAGDAYSNEGTPQTSAEFARAARAAHAAGVSALYWRPAYTGAPYRRDNWSNRTVNPFSGAACNDEQAAVQSLLAIAR